MQRTGKIILLIVILLIFGALFLYSFKEPIPTKSEVIGDTDIGTVEKNVYGNESLNNTIALITGIHPREKLAIEPEIQAAKDFASEHRDTKVIHYQVNVTQSPEDYEIGRANGESLVHDFVNPDVTQSDADCVIISHSHVEGYGEGFYLATPEMDDASVNIATQISEKSDFNYYPTTGNETYKSTSAVLVSRPIAQAGYPTFVYEIPENINDGDSTNKAKDLFGLMVEYAC